jgi:uncharacterized OsmC-like protein
VTMHA